MTLIEVLAATALLGVLLSATLVAIGRQTRQVRLAQDRIAALNEADRLLRVWLVEQQGAVDAEEGAVRGRPEWRWRVGGRPSPGLEPLGAHLARLEIIDTRPDRQVDVLASLEFVSTSPATASRQTEGDR